MVYHGTSVHEMIQFQAIGDPDFHFIEMIKSADEPTFSVICCCEPEWYYEFYMENNSDYERVKMTIMDEVFDCQDVEELLDELNDIFEEMFEDILVEDDCDCDDCCAHCECSKYLN